MKKDLSTLISKYPLLFPSSEENEPFNDWGFECSAGWYDLLNITFNTLYANYSHHRSTLSYYQQRLEKEKTEELKQKVEEIQQKVDLEKSKLPVIEQCKSKFGTLRLYCRNTNDISNAVIHMAELLSAITCEICGQNGSQIRQGWVRVSCPDCEEKRKKRIEEKGCFEKEIG
jgi:hypothetical protein